MPPDAAAQFLVTTFGSRTYQVFAAVYFVGIFAGPVLMGFALWRSRSAPRWLAVLFFASLELAQQLESTARPARRATLPFRGGHGLAGRLDLAGAAWLASCMPEPVAVPVSNP